MSAVTGDEIVEHIRNLKEISGASPASKREVSNIAIQGGRNPISVIRKTQRSIKHATDPRYKDEIPKEVVDVSVDVTNPPTTKEEQQSEQIIRMLKDENLEIKSLVAIKTDTDGSSTPYYEVYTRTGDPFYIKVNMNNNCLSVYVPGTKETVGTGDTARTGMMGSFEFTECEGQILPVREVSSSSCANDPVCSSIFKCVSGSDTCNEFTNATDAMNPVPDTTTIYSVSAPKETSDVRSFMFHDKRPIAAPVMSLSEFIADPVSATVKVANMTTETQKNAMDANTKYIKNVKDRAMVFLESMAGAFESFGNSVIKTGQRQLEVDKLIAVWERYGNASTDEQKKNFDALVKMRMSNNMMANDLVQMGKEYMASISQIETLQKNMMGQEVKMWLAVKLRDFDNVKDSTSMFGGSLPTDVSSLSRDDMLSAVYGEGKRYMEAKEKFMRSTEVQNIYKELFDETPSKFTTEHYDKIQSLSSTAGNRLTSPELVKTIYRIYSLTKLDNYISALKTSGSEFVNAKKSTKMCGKDNICVDIDKNGHISAKAKGNMPGMGEVRTVNTTERYGGISNERLVLEDPIEAVESMLKNLNI